MLKLFHADNVVLRKNVVSTFPAKAFFPFAVEQKCVARVDANERVGTVIEIVRSYSKIEVENVDGVHLFYIWIILPFTDVLGNGFRTAK